MAVTKSRVTGTAGRPETQSAVQITWPLLDDVLPLLDLVMVATVEILVIKHNAVRLIQV